MKHVLKEKLHEALRSVLPLSIMVAALDLCLLVFFGSSLPWGMFFRFLIGAAFLFLGIFFLLLGEDLAMIQMGRLIGAHLVKTRKYVLLIICCFLLGAFVMVAEPNLAVFASIHHAIDKKTIIYTVALGVGAFTALSLLRVFRRIPLPVVLTAIYLVVFSIAAFAPSAVVPAAFDAGGVATGPITTAFIMSVGIGLAAVRGGKSSTDESFGAVAVCMVGPIIAMLLLGIFRGAGETAAAESAVHAAEGSEIILDFIRELPEIVEEVAFALLPIIAFFTLFQFIFLRMGKERLLGIGVGAVSDFVGHVLFLTGAFVGFLPAGSCLGSIMASLPGGYKALLIPAGMIMGGFIVHAEPAVHVLLDQVESVTVGAVTKRAMKIMLTVGVALASGISMLRILTGISIWYFLLGGYALSLALSFFVPKVFTAIAFDSGGAATGAMAVSFMLPFAKGACSVISGSGESILTDAFGMIALLVVFPIITIQVMGLLFKLKLRKVSYKKLGADDSVRIIEFDTEK